MALSLENDMHLRRAALALERMGEAEVKRRYLRALRCWMEDRQLLAEMLRQETGLDVRMSAPKEFLFAEPAACQQ